MLVLLAAALAAPGELLWTIQATEDPVAASDGSAVYAVGADSRLRALDPRTGMTTWAAPDQGTWKRPRTFPGGLYAVANRGRGDEVCRLDAVGKIHWCTVMGRRVDALLVAGEAIAAVGAMSTAQVLDPASGRPLGDWILGDETHVWYEGQDGHDTVFSLAIRLLGAFGGRTLYARGGGWSGVPEFVAVRPDGTVAWRVAESGYPYEDARVPFTPGVSFGGGRLFLGQKTLLVVDASGHLVSTRPVAEGSWLTVTPAGTWLEAHDSIARLDPTTGAELWRHALTGFPGLPGIARARTSAEDPRHTLERLDPETGALLGTSEVGDAIGWIQQAPCGTLVIPALDANFRCLDSTGTPVWSLPDTHQVQLLGDRAVHLSNQHVASLVDLATGATIPLPGELVAVAADIALVRNDGAFSGVSLR